MTGSVRKATIRDVAREANVSVASVSRAMNGLTTVTEKTRAHIQAVADRLGYIPHAGARSLSLSRTNVIGVVLPDLHGEFFSELVRGMDRMTAACQYQMLYSTMHADPELARKAVLAMHGRVDGMIVMAPQLSSERVAALLPKTTPAVLLNSANVVDRDRLRIDNRSGAALVMTHLLSAGRRRIVHIGGPAGNFDAQERADGMRAALSEHAPDATLTVIEGDFLEESGARAVRQLLDERRRFDAIFAANDGMAFGALAALREAGLSVPGDVAVAGFDDVPLARYVGLTTARVPLDELGGGAIRQLIDRLAGDDSAYREIEIAPELVIRATTDAAPRIVQRRSMLSGTGA